MNFTNENMDQTKYQSILKILFDSVIDGKQLHVTENHFVTLRSIIENVDEFIISIEQIYVNEIDIEPYEFDLNIEEIYEDFVEYLNSLFILKFYFRDQLYFGLNDVFMRNTIREHNNLHELADNFLVI